MSLRGAVSIARRLQDPLAELVKIDPKSIGVGQYQHDLPEHQPVPIAGRGGRGLRERGRRRPEHRVGAVAGPGVRASATALAASIVGHRDASGEFRSRRALLEGAPARARRRSSCAPGSCGSPVATTRWTPPACTRRPTRWCAGWPGRRPTDLAGLIGNTERAGGAATAADFVDERFGLPTVTDILAELDKPGRDPRPAFTTARFAEGVETLADLRPGMVLEGTVTNVAAFGAFVDIGVHQDGLVHISAMSNSFVNDPRDVVKSGDIVRVKVLEVDVARKRIGLTLRLTDDAVATAPVGASRAADGRSGAGGPTPRPAGGRSGGRGRSTAKPAPKPAPAPTGTMAEALRRAGLGG